MPGPLNCCAIAYVDLSQKFEELWSIWIGWTVTDASTRVSLLGTAGCTVCFLRTNWYCMRGSSQQGLQLAFDRFSAARDQAGTTISTEKIEVSYLSTRRPRRCILQMSGNTLQQVETFKYLGVVFTSDGSRNKEIDTRIVEANAVLRELHCFVVTKRELSKNAKLSVFKSVFVPILNCDHEFFVTTERLLSKEQTAEIGYLRRVLGVTLRGKEHRSVIHKARDVKPLLRIARSQLC